MFYDKLLQDAEHLQDLMQLLTGSIAAEVVGKLDDALEGVEQALALDPAFMPALMRRAGLLLMQQRYDEALAACDVCLERFPAMEEAVTLRHRALLLALDHCRHALTACSSDTNLLCRQAHLLAGLERFDEALDSLDRVLTMAPTHLQALNQRGEILLRLNRHEQAVLCYDRILAQSSTDAVTMFNRGNVLRKMNCIHQALWCYEQALILQPDFPEAETEQSHCLLQQENYAGGWQHHEARWRTRQLRGQGLFPEVPAWLGEPALDGHSIVLWAEQGLGDTIQFARYIPLIAGMADRVTVCIPQTLQRLLASLRVPPHVTLTSNDKQLPVHDFHCPLMSLPLALSWKLASVPATVPYLHADAQSRRTWSAALGSSTGLKVGLAWAGRQAGSVNHTRDIPLRHLRSLAGIDVTMVSLQQQIPASDASEQKQWPHMRHFADDMTDMAETAALIDNLDLVISADTAVIHLAGALGKPAWLLLRYESEWRWGWQTSSSRWYPTVKVFRQKNRGDWYGVAEEVADCLRLAAENAGAFRL